MDKKSDLKKKQQNKIKQKLLRTFGLAVNISLKDSRQISLLIINEFKQFI